MLSDTARPVIEATLPVVAAHLDEITPRFYARMFAARPELLDGIFSRANQHNLDRFTVGKRVEGWLQGVSDATETGKSHDAESAQRGAGRNEAITRRTV